MSGDKPSRVRSLRLSDDLDAAARDVARIEGIPINALIVTAVETEIAKRRADPAFGDRLRARIEADQQILDRLTRLT